MPPVLANEGALVQVLINLIANARDACAATRSPEIVIRTRFVSGPGAERHPPRPPGRSCRSRSRSATTAPASTPRSRDHIFEPFVSQQEERAGPRPGAGRTSWCATWTGASATSATKQAGGPHFGVHAADGAMGGTSDGEARAAGGGRRRDRHGDHRRRSRTRPSPSTAATASPGATSCSRASGYDVMLTDVMLTDGDGIATLGRRSTAPIPTMPVIILSAQNTLDTAVRATDTGAFEYFPKPFDLDELVRAACQAAGSARRAHDGDRDEAGEGLPLIGRSQAMQDVYRMITRVLRNDLTVLVLGESGTGKELVAEAIHQLGARKAGPFVAVNTAAIPRELIESELFGHEKGAFTGAVSRSIGKFEQAHGGTLFLDEIGDMPPEAQTPPAARAAVGPHPPRRRARGDRDRRAHHRRHQPRPRADDRRRAASARTCTTASTWS